MATPASPDDDPRHAPLLRLLVPLARLALQQGLTLQSLGELTKVALAGAAMRADPGASMSQIAVRTGVHRKDLRRLVAQPTPRAPRSPGAEVFARWMTDPRYLTRRGQPRVLPRVAAGADEPSFDALATSVTTDVHPRAVLEELLRLALVAIDARGRVRLTAKAYVPHHDRAGMLALLADNVGDHLDAAVANLAADGERFLEQAMFSDGLTAASAETFNRATRRAWFAIQADLMPLLQRLYDTDRGQGAPADHRVRVGVYSYTERVPDEN